MIFAAHPPRKLLTTALVAASIDPLALWIAWLHPEAPSFGQHVVISLPNYACAIVAVLPSQVLQRIGRRLREAQELGSYQLVELLGPAAWARCGAPSTACWRATPRRSSWCARGARRAQ